MFDPANVVGSNRDQPPKLIEQALFISRMSKPPANIHDAFFKRIMSDPQSAGQFLREHLPPDVAVLMSEDPPELQSGSFVDEDLAQHQTDLLFRIRLREGAEALAYILAEHKSAPDPVARLQLLRYVTRVLVQWHRENERLPLPAVVPLLAHHGPSGWSFSTDFEDLYGRVADSLRPYLVTFRHALVDLARIDDRALSQHLRLRAFLKALKYILRADLAEHLESVLADALALDRIDLGLVLQYISAGPVRVSHQTVQDALHHLTPEKEEMGFIEEFQQQGFEKGLEKGEAGGFQRGKASTLIQVLELRFGPLKADSRERILKADITSMDAWLSRVIKAPDLRAIFE